VTAFAHQLVREQALRSPEAVAVSGPDGSLTYAELRQRWETVAARLQAAGLQAAEARPERPVAVCVGRSADAVVALLAVLAAGGVYAPVALDGPADRVAGILAALDPAVVLADAGSLAAAGRVGPPVVDVSAVGAAAAGHAGGPSPSVREPVLQADQLAYVQFTSGSTGTPKGVAMSHRGLRRLIDWQLGDVEPGLATLYFTPTGFDVTFQEVFSTLATGGRLCLVTDEVRRDPDKLLVALDEQQVERVFLPYVALHELAMAAEGRQAAPAALRHVVTAGEALIITDAIASFFRRLPHCRLDNHYGPTETHLVTSATLAAGQAWPTVPPIGFPVGGVRVAVLDQELREVADGVSGELYVGGDAVGRGYLGDPAGTADRFLPDPSQQRPGDRMYRTGDLVRRDPDGTLSFLGRADGQLKVRGYRVEPGEVEAALTAHPAVRQAAVGVRPLGGDVTGLVAYLAADPAEPRPAPSALISFLRPRVPDYMIPSRLLWLDALPLGATGKVDRRRLADIPLPAPALADPALAGPGESLGGLISSIWQRVLGHDDFTAADDFFEIGGDSLLAVWVVNELAQALGGPVDLSLFLEDSTIEGLTAGLASAAGRPAPSRPQSQLVTLKPGPAQRPLVLFHALGGELLAYRELARALTAPLRVVGVRWSGPPPATTTLADTAAGHVEQLRAVHGGPYLLAGWSYGGVLAYEVARQLRRDGDEVEFLGLIDAHPCYDPISGRPPDQTPYLADIDRLVAEIDARGRAGDPSAEVPELVSGQTWSQLMGTAGASAGSVEQLAGPLTLARGNLAALRSYQPQPYDGVVDLFRTGALDADVRAEMARSLRALAPAGLHIHELPGDHLGILRGEPARVLAALMDRALERGKGDT